MKASELRIGNLIKGKSPEKKVYEEPVELNEYYFLLFLNNMMDVEPIPLTEEWLLKFGFVSNPYKDRYELIAKINIIIECDKTKGLVDLYCEQFPHIKYVHSLQNLYFALTGEELTLKNKEQ